MCVCARTHAPASVCVSVVRKIAKVRRVPFVLAALWDGEFNWRSLEALCALLSV